MSSAPLGRSNRNPGAADAGVPVLPLSRTACIAGHSTMQALNILRRRAAARNH
jgi:hypothetical protein